MKYHIAVDLGAASGRVILGRFGEDGLDLEVMHRFPNTIQESGGHQRWNTVRLFEEIKTGLGAIAASVDPAAVAGIGVDSWGVDYGLLDSLGRLIEEPVCYRDHRTDGVMDEVFRIVEREKIYDLTGIQLMPFNTIFQLHAQKIAGEWPEEAAAFVMMPDLMHHYLCGSRVGEFTNATTTQLMSARTRQWAPALFDTLGLDLGVMPDLVQAGAVIGTLTEDLQREVGLPGVNIVAPATHDTGSAVVGTPLEEDWLYLSSGTWSLLGIETEEAVISEKTSRYNFTNEGGAYGTNRFLKNMTGLWILERCREEWKKQGVLLDYDTLMREMEAAQPFAGLIFPDDPRFLNPENMVDEVCAALEEHGMKAVRDQVRLSRIILESMAFRYDSVVEMIRDCTGKTIRGIRIVGGGSRNDVLNQATANATGLPVAAGPMEATAIGNLTVQAITAGRFSHLQEARDYLRRTGSVRTFEPEDTTSWKAVKETYGARTKSAE